ncbi:MAG TPA: alpha/beta hydrolase [Steroidobacter sp.]|uniref:alpha/beta fold hydrolase n=1 Tax=Steroidobacter sp. TaxID=1978227 RepID=UPI002ED8F6E5
MSLPVGNTWSRRRLLAAAGLAMLTACISPRRSLDSSSIATGKIDVGDGWSLPYWDTGGTGTPLVLMHAFAGSIESWPEQQTAFADAGFRVIAYSRRGVGAARPITTPINHANDLERVLDALGIRRAHLVTVAGGATVAADFMISHPERVASAVFACSLISFQDPLLLAARKAAAPARSPEGRRLPAAELELSKAYRDSHPEGTRRWDEIRQRAQSSGIAPRAQTNEVTLEAIAATGVPILLIAGEHDRLLTPQMLDTVAARLPNAEPHVISDAGHQVHWEQPGAFNALVLDFLRRQPAS